MGQKEDDLTARLLLGSLEIVQYVEKANTWMLAGTGATIALFISSIDDVNKILSQTYISLILLSLCLSSLFGFASKIHSVRAHSVRVMFQSIFDTLDRHPDTDVTVALENYITSFPKWISWKIRRGANKGIKDPLYGFKVAQKIVIYQNLYATIQGMCLILAVFIATLGAI